MYVLFLNSMGGIVVVRLSPLLMIHAFEPSILLLYIIKSCKEMVFQTDRVWSHDFVSAILRVLLYDGWQDSDQLEYLLPKKTSLAHRLPMGDQGFVAFVGYLLNINPLLRPTASEALKHPWLSFPYEPISS